MPNTLVQPQPIYPNIGHPFHHGVDQASEELRLVVCNPMSLVRMLSQSNKCVGILLCNIKETSLFYDSRIKNISTFNRKYLFTTFVIKIKNKIDIFSEGI